VCVCVCVCSKNYVWIRCFFFISGFYGHTVTPPTHLLLQLQMRLRAAVVVLAWAEDGGGGVVVALALQIALSSCDLAQDLGLVVGGGRL